MLVQKSQTRHFRTAVDKRADTRHVLELICAVVRITGSIVRLMVTYRVGQIK